MANPLLTQKKKGYDVDDSTNSTMKRNIDQTDKDALARQNKEKLVKFQAALLEENIDYLALQSSLSLLHSRASAITKDIKDLNNFKKSIYELEDGKSLHQLILNNSDYLKEINYKGCCVRCPSIQWNQNYGLNLEFLNDEGYETINENYEIIKKDRLFK